MAHLLKVSEWTIGNKWYVADISDLANDSSAWWHPARMLGLSLEDYIMLLINEYHAEIKWFPDSNNGKSLLVFSFANYSDAHKYLLYINRIARNKNWSIC